MLVLAVMVTVAAAVVTLVKLIRSSQQSMAVPVEVVEMSVAAVDSVVRVSICGPPSGAVEKLTVLAKATSASRSYCDLRRRSERSGA